MSKKMIKHQDAIQFLCDFWERYLKQNPLIKEESIWEENAVLIENDSNCWHTGRAQVLKNLFRHRNEVNMIVIKSHYDVIQQEGSLYVIHGQFMLNREGTDHTDLFPFLFSVVLRCYRHGFRIVQLCQSALPSAVTAIEPEAFHPMETQFHEQYYKHTLEVAHDCVLGMDFSTGSAWILKSTFSNIPKGESLQIECMFFIYPLDFERVWKFFHYQTLQDAFSKGITSFALDHRILVSGQNKPIWVRSVLVPIPENNGTFIKAMCSIKDIDACKRYELETTRRSNMDSLTDLYNKKYTADLVDEYLLRVCEKAGALFVIDIDCFKSINDNHGHLRGDNVLIEIATQLKTKLCNNEILGRIGGDEFVVFYKNIVDVETLKQKADELVLLFQREVIWESKKCNISASIGVAIAPQDGTNFNTLFEHADTALYKAKSMGKNCFCFYYDIQ